jgi:uncharacterized metal-binding protein
MDGCPMDCVKKTLLEAGFADFRHVQLAQLEMDKGKSPATEGRINAAAEAGRQALSS